MIKCIGMVIQIGLSFTLFLVFKRRQHSTITRCNSIVNYQEEYCEPATTQSIGSIVRVREALRAIYCSYSTYIHNTRAVLSGIEW